MNLTAWDIQSKHIYTVDGAAPPLYSGECRYGGGEAYVLITKEDAKDIVNAERSGGAIIRWNYEETADCLRANTKNHEPIVVVSVQENHHGPEELDGKKSVPQPYGGDVSRQY